MFDAQRIIPCAMRTILFLFSLLILAGNAKAEATWNIHYEAEKGDTTVSIPKEPASLDSYIHKLPDYSPDPFDSKATIENSAVRVAGNFHEHQVVEVCIRIRESFYTDLYLLLYEMQPGRYLPIYAQQYNRGTRTPKLTSFSVADRHCSIKVVARYSGTLASKTSDNIILTQDERHGAQLRCRRD